MNNVLRAMCAGGALLLAPLVMAEDAAAPAAAPEVAPVEAAPPAAGDAPVITVTAAGDQAVVVNTGNETVDAAANYASKCAERTAALKSCDAMGGFKAMGCRKVAEMRYKSVTNCPNL